MLQWGVWPSTTSNLNSNSTHLEFPTLEACGCEIRYTRNALGLIIGTEALLEIVLLTLLTEVEGILNAKLLRYMTSDIADPDPAMPSML